MLAARRERMLMEGHPGLASGLVFPTQAGRPHRGTPLGPVLRAACERVEIGIRFTPHGLRRTWNNLARRVADGMVVRAMIGHADEAMTEHYSRVGVEEKRTAARAVADLFQAPVERQNVSQDVSGADSEPAGAPGEPPDED
jgi:integrase